MTKIAIIGPSFFGYLETIAEQLKARGHAAVFFDERPSNSTLNKLFLRIAPRRLTGIAVHKHSKGLADQILTGGFTHVLFISSEVFTTDQAARLQKADLDCVRYAFDSNRNKRVMTALDPYVRAIASFDPEDCERLGYTYIALYAEMTDLERDLPRDIDVMYCGSLHSNRPHYIQRLSKAARDLKMQTCFMLFFQSKPLWFLRYGWDPRRWSLLRMLNNISFSRKDIMDAQLRAKVVIDIHHPAQTGLTMRFFEALACGAVVLTTNPYAHRGVPAALEDRVVQFETATCAQALGDAAQRASGPVPADVLKYLSIDRFLDQIESLLNLEGAEVS